MEINQITEKIIGSAIEVHRQLGPGLLEGVYRACMVLEMRTCGLSFESEKIVPIVYKGKQLEYSYRMDFIVQNSVIVELKSVASLLPVHEAQILTYLKLTGCKVGLLINFNVPILRNGIKRLII